MTNHRILSATELKYVKRQLRTSKKLLFWLFAVFVVIVSSVAFFIYSKEGFGNFLINVIFGFFILLIGFLYWFFKGYKNHKTNPIVYKSKGFYKRVYEQRGKNGVYYDTFNGIKVKLPWHWRKYLKTLDEAIEYEYILRDGAVAMNEMAMLIISADKLTLDYELNHGLNKIKPISMFNILSFILVIPAVIIICFDNNFKDALRVSELFKTNEKHTVILKNAEDLKTISTSNFIKIEKAWVYQFKRYGYYSSKNYIISEQERNRIYNHPNSDYNHWNYIESDRLTKPKKEHVINSLQTNPYLRSRFRMQTDTSAINRYVNTEYQRRIEVYNKDLRHSKIGDTLIKTLTPKGIILEINEENYEVTYKSSNTLQENDGIIEYTDVFNQTNMGDSYENKRKKGFRSAKESLEHPFTVKGFYIPKDRQIISSLSLKHRRNNIKGASIFVGLSLAMLLLAGFSVFKIVRNSKLKKRLVKEQLDFNNLKRLN